MTFADVEFRILPKNATGYPVEIAVQTETGRQEFLGGIFDPAGSPGVAAAVCADTQQAQMVMDYFFRRQHELDTSAYDPFIDK